MGFQGWTGCRVIGVICHKLWEQCGNFRARAVFQAWRDGRRAAWLPGEDYERLFADPNR